MSGFMFDPVAMDHRLMTNNMMANSTVNDLVVVDFSNNDLMALTERANGLAINDSGVDHSMFGDFVLTVNDTMAHAHSMNSSSIGIHTTNAPKNVHVVVGDSIGTPMSNSSTAGTMVDSSATKTQAVSIFTPLMREKLRHQMLFVDGARKTEGIWLCVKCFKHLDRGGNKELQKWHAGYGIRLGCELHPEARTKKLNCTHCKERRRCDFVKRSQKK